MIIDISWPISEGMTAYKDKKTVTFTAKKEFDRDKARETLLTLNAHSGTHIDAPSHFLQDGGTIDQLNLESVCGPCLVVDCTSVTEHITADDLKDVEIAPGMIVLFKTKNSEKSPENPFDPAFIYLEKSGAEYLASQKVKAVGIDYLGIERNQPDHETHTILLEKHIPIIEGLRLGEVTPGQYQLFCLPLALRGLEAAPARAILLPL